jgi:hypothetical protein
MTKTIRPKFPATHQWQAVLDLAFEREADDSRKGEPVQLLSDYVDEIVRDGREALVAGLSEFFDGPIEIVPQMVKKGAKMRQYKDGWQLTPEQREVIQQTLIADWLETADRADVVEHLMQGTCPVVSKLATDWTLVGLWADLGNENLPGVDGTFE